mmetsp:Transcript_19471/g.52406  ORF Transcript_19471/g.52406 Transcript_19471/m.52406 type:complete len:230 (+) Transcript_19471:457-1146(+)
MALRDGAFDRRLNACDDVEVAPTSQLVVEVLRARGVWGHEAALLVVVGLTQWARARGGLREETFPSRPPLVAREGGSLAALEDFVLRTVRGIVFQERVSHHGVAACAQVLSTRGCVRCGGGGAGGDLSRLICVHTRARVPGCLHSEQATRVRLAHELGAAHVRGLLRAVLLAGAEHGLLKGHGLPALQWSHHTHRHLVYGARVRRGTTGHTHLHHVRVGEAPVHKVWLR